MTPAHYAGPVTPWDLERCMRTSGSVFVDARRTDAIEYLFRIKGTREDQIRDLEKARHCIEAAIAAMPTPKPPPSTESNPGRR